KLKERKRPWTAFLKTLQVTKKQDADGLPYSIMPPVACPHMPGLRRVLPPPLSAKPRSDTRLREVAVGERKTRRWRSKRYAHLKMWKILTMPGIFQPVFKPYVT